MQDILIKGGQVKLTFEDSNTFYLMEANIIEALLKRSIELYSTKENTSIIYTQLPVNLDSVK